MTPDAYVRAMMVRFAVEEGQKYGGTNNMLAILHVIRNRVMAGWGDWLDVVEAAPLKRGNISPPAAPNMRLGDVRIVLNRVDEIYQKTDTVDLTGGALFYVDPGQPMNDWFRREVIEKPDAHRRTAHIGPVWFYA